MSARAPQRRARTAAPGHDAAAVGAAWPLLAALAGTLALRAAALALPGRWAWGVDLGRDLPTAAFWLPWAAAAVALVPAAGGRIARALPRGERAVRVGAFALAALAAALAWSLPDRSWLVGDTALRHGGFALVPDGARMAPQAGAADLWLHHDLPRAAAARWNVTPETWNRAWDALLAAANVLAAWALARAVARDGRVRLAVTVVAGFTGAVALFNGYAKSIVELNVLVLVTAGALLSLARTGRGLLRLGLAVGAAIVLHRSALALIPAWLAAVALTHVRNPAAWRRPANVVGALAPALGLAFAGPAIVRTIASFDAAHHFAGGLRGGPSWLTHALSPAHTADALQAVLLIAPLAPVLLVLPAVPRAGVNARGRRDELTALAALTLPLLAVVLLVEPQQGLIRDWDVFVPAGVALSALAAWCVAATLEAAPRAAWLALAAALVAAAPPVQLLAHQADTPRALARLESLLGGPPARGDAERAIGYDQIGAAYYARGQYDLAGDAYRRATALVPNAKFFTQWGMAATLAGRPSEALSHYLEAARIAPDQLLAWRGVAAASSALGDMPHMALAAAQLQRLDPGGPATRDALEYLKSNRPAGGAPGGAIGVSR